MSELQKETEFFQDIPTKVRGLVKSSKEVSIVQDKGSGDYSTTLDIDVEDLIVEEIQKRFPQDLILAEEKHADVEIPEGRIWIIDPICGTSNLGKAINNFCTNIALADNGGLIASCVIDHSNDDYFWSVGENKVYINNKLYQPASENLGIKIDIDLGAVRKADESIWRKHNNSILKLINETNYDLISLNTSLGFAYTAIGKVDGFINLFNHPWDICAASFLIQQSGGIITTLDGLPWTISSVGAIGAVSPEIHNTLLSA